MRGNRRVLKNILLKLANGFTYTETTEEYSPQKEQEESLVLSKRKVSTHYVPPDMLAIKMLLENDRKKVESLAEKYSAMTDEELLSLRNKLLNELKQEQK